MLAHRVRWKYASTHRSGVGRSDSRRWNTRRGTRTTPRCSPISTPNSTAWLSAFQWAPQPNGCPAWDPDPHAWPSSTYEGRTVGRNIVDGPKYIPDYASIPACVFTVPALASVGLTQAAAEEQGMELRVEVNDVHEWLSGRTYAETAAWAKY